MADDVKPDSLYERDFVAWTEHQAAALRARRQGANALDYDNLAEEIEDLGKSETRGCRSHVERIIEHLLKLEFVPSPETYPHWRGEIVNFRAALEDDLTPTIRNRLQAELPKLFARQVRQLTTREVLDAHAVSAARGDGYTWDQIVDPDWYPEPRV